VIETVDRAADQMAGIVQDLLLLAQADSGQLGQNQERLCVREIAEKALEGVWATDSPPIQLDISEPSPAIFGNGGQIKRALRNLAQNAIDHTPTGGCVIISAVAQAGEVEIAVVDNGEGIAREHIVHLTERFYRVDTARSRQTGGTGLGLAIVKSIVDAHGGRLRIESSPGAGTTVRVWFTQA
jgi:two-component system phosphate regulon sensor histidine kinase PhoR